METDQHRVDPFEIDNIRIPEYFLNEAGTAATRKGKIPEWPILVFVNTKSGGQLGLALLETFHRLLLDSHQVFDLSKDHPDEVLRKVLTNLERLKAQGDKNAEKIRATLRLVVAGGDGTAGWLLGVVGDLKLEIPPPIATIPLGTGNNLPFSFGWGKRNPGTDAESVKKFLRGVVEAHPLNIDSWHVAMTMEGKDVGEIEAPHSLHAFKKSPECCKENSQGYRGGFWNYFSIGMDAQVSYEFHKERQEHPERFKNQLKNQSNYARIGCKQGWFCASCMHPSTKNINEIAKVYTAEKDGEYQELQISSSIRSLVFLNLPSFSGGLDPWGNPNDKKSVQRGLKFPSVNDGLMEIVGFRDGWHGMFLLFPNGHGTRLAQARRVKIEFKRGTKQNHAYMRMDGEPWKQPMPENDEVTYIEISHHGQAVMLAKTGCIAESKNDYQHIISFTKHGIEHGLHLKHENDNGSTTSHMDPGISVACECECGEKKKFGAASTFKI